MAHIPNPQQLNLPEKFQRWRPGHEEAISLALDSDKRVTSLCAPTGYGKSVVAVAIAAMSKVPTAVVTNTKGLQSQYMSDFESMGMVDLRGRNNYQCEMREGYTCDDGHNAKCPYRGGVGCPSSKAEIKAASSSLVVTNYSKWCASKRFGTGLAHIQQVIFDEGHHMPEAIASAMQVVLNHNEIEEGLKVDFPRGLDAEDINVWRNWAIYTKGVAESVMITLQAKIQNAADPKPSWVKQYNHHRQLVRRLAILSLAKADDWVVEQIQDAYQFDPVRTAKYAEAALFFRIPKIVAVSATLRPKTMFMCGVGRDNFVFKEFASDFDPKRCPIYYVPTMRVDSRSGDLGLLWVRLDQLVAKRQNRKGIVHSVSYQRQMEIRNRSRFSNQMIWNEKGSPATETVDLFKSSKPGTILVSPSIAEGYDFPGDECRWQFVCKIPFEPPSRIVKAREADDPEYRSYQAMQQLVQAFGRGMRSKTDYCENVIGDDHLEWFLPRYGHLAPKSFHGFYKRVNVLPPPLSF